MSSETSPRTFFLAHVVSRATLVDASNANAGGGLTFEDVYSTYAVEAMLGPRIERAFARWLETGSRIS